MNPPSNNSRRNFLASAAVLVAGTACGKNESQAQAQAPAAAVPAAAPAAGTSGLTDVRVAHQFCRSAGSFPDIEKDPHLAVLVYGLACLDKDERELLLPPTAQLGNTHEHHPRLYATEGFSGRQPDGEIDVDGKILYYWDLAGVSLSWEAAASGRQGLRSRKQDLQVQSSSRHPWSGDRWFRNLKELTGLDLIDSSKRSNPSHVRARVKVGGGHYEAVAPYSAQGALFTWKATTYDSKEIEHSTTDAMLFTQSWEQADQLQFNFMALDGKSRLKDPVLFNVPMSKRVKVVIAHASHSSPPSLDKIYDSKAYALLLEGGDPTKFPEISISRGVRGEVYAAAAQVSVVGGHCESAIKD